MVQVDFYSANCAIDTDTNTYLIVHGFQNDSQTDWVLRMTDNLVNLDPDANIISVDWSESTLTLDYNAAVEDTLAVGEIIADYLLEIEVNPSTTQLIGHSLGAHVSGIAGDLYDELTGNPIDTIIGLDPAGPEYEPSSLKEARIESERLDPLDAERAIALHTSTFLGYDRPLGDLDVYLNWQDEFQPGQSNFIDNHGYAHQVYNELLEGDRFLQRPLFGSSGVLFNLDDLQNRDITGTIYVNTNVV